MNSAGPAERLAAGREFNRMDTTSVVGAGARRLRRPYALPEVRVLFELSQRDSMPVTVLRQTLGLDPGYLSRLLARFESDGLVARERSSTDARAQAVALTAAGKAVFNK